MPELIPLNADLAPAVLAFERANRAYFTTFVTDRGDAWFDAFQQRFGALLAEQADGVCACYALVEDDGPVLGRFNLIDIADGAADLGYRVAQHAAGRGVATAAVRELCAVAPARHGLRRLRAAAAHTNPASRRVLAKAGFTPVAEADPADLGGKPGTWFARDLTSGA